MNSTDYRGRIQDISFKIPCVFCGISADLESDDVIVETHGHHFSHGETLQVWHRCCFDDFLDQGEET